MIARRAAWVGVGLLLAGCGAPTEPGSPLPQTRWLGERVAIASDAPPAAGWPDDWLCAGTLARLDAHVANMERLSGLRREGRALVYLLKDPVQVREICGGSLRGRCYDPPLRASVLDVAR